MYNVSEFYNHLKIIRNHSYRIIYDTDYYILIRLKVCKYILNKIKINNRFFKPKKNVKTS